MVHTIVLTPGIYAVKFLKMDIFLKQCLVNTHFLHIRARAIYASIEGAVQEIAGILDGNQRWLQIFNIELLVMLL